ncbi:uncharacterized protein LOC101532567 [Ochotona princeps]|uniref:uncharacterized protein LOC101532567 n=1 Tax=Ochotona princeps TaxID=9978 RepID=UPI0027155C5A|nr:uncharacterized protein LOC101532567 [Ochotona princeps]
MLLLQNLIVEAADGRGVRTEARTLVPVCHCHSPPGNTVSLQKFQQKAVKQTKQKKSKSAEFLMVKEDRDAMEGIINPAFHMSSPDLSAAQTSTKSVIRCDMLARTLAAHPQEFRLPASSEPKGNEYSRNYFDPLMDEEINPRQCGMEVSREGDDTILYNRLMKLFDGNEQGEPQDGSIKEEMLDSEALKSSKGTETSEEDNEAITADIEELEKQAQKEAILLGSSPFQQDLKFEGEEFNQYIPMSHLKMDRIFGRTPRQPYGSSPHVCKQESIRKVGPLTRVPDDLKGPERSCWKVEQSALPQPLQIQIKCIRGLKDRAPHGFYLLRASLLDRPGSHVLPWWQTEQMKIQSHPVRHGGNFYDVGLYFHESLYVALPPKKAVRPGLALLFELFLLHGTYTSLDRVVGWAVFPLCDNNFHVVDGKFKCPLLRGHYDRKVGNFREIEDLICLDLDHWLGNIYFQVMKLPLHVDDQNQFESHTQPSPELPACLMTGAEKAETCVDNLFVLSEKEKENVLESTKEETECTCHSSLDLQVSFRTGCFCTISAAGGSGLAVPLARSYHQRFTNKKPWSWEKPEYFATVQDSDLGEKRIYCGVMTRHSGTFQEELTARFTIEIFSFSCVNFSDKRHRLTDHLVKDKSAVWAAGASEDVSQNKSYLEELEQHQFSVWCSSGANGSGSGDFVKHLRFVLMSVSSELQLAQWQSQSFWYILLLLASVWFLRLHLHYLGQWLFLQAIAAPVTKFQFLPHTVELCYPASLLHAGEELPVVAVGTLMLNAVILLLVLVKWGCQLLFASCPDVLSKLIITMGLWTVLDPLAVFIVDTILGRFSYNEETPVADAAKLYWVFVRMEQPAILGVGITVLVYIGLFSISSLTLYLYCLRLHNNSWVLDAFQRIHSDENKFFMPHDLEISNQELSYIVKRSEQWRGMNGERRKVAVCDYIWNSPGLQSSVASCDPQHRKETSVTALGPGDVTSHVSIYTVYPSGFQELYRHFLRLPGGAIVEVRIYGNSLMQIYVYFVV